RPADARRALHVFIQNEAAPPPPPPKEKKPAAGPPAVKRPGAPAAIRVHTGPIQTQAPVAKTQAAPKPLTPPEGFKPSVHTASVFLGDVLVPAPDAPSAIPAPTTGMVTAKAAPNAPTSRMAGASAPVPKVAAATPTARAASPTPTRGGPPAPQVGARSTFVPPPVKPKKKLKKSEVTTIWIAVILIIGFVGFLLVKFS
ncbi:MAG TPA: hypothetical protein VM511_13875, partial [Luteolibacter sp.]|nr:hypothetical protein [Luteolibacter sp.]